MPRLLLPGLLLLLCLVPLGQLAFAQRPPGYVDNVEEQMAQMHSPNGETHLNMRYCYLNT